MKTRVNFSLLPVFLILAVALVVFFPVLKRWAPLGDLVSPRVKLNMPAGPVRIWVNKRSGLYYCSDSPFFGQIDPGMYMVQAEALQKGYRPAGKWPCR